MTIDALLPEVYDHLRRVATRLWSESNGAATVQPTMLVHEVYLRLARDPDRTWANRAHLVAVAARAMRQVLADRARRRSAIKRGGGLDAVTLSGLGTADDPLDLISVDDALRELEALDARRAEVFTLRALGGMEVLEVAELLGVSPRTVKSDWRVARAWLGSRLAEGGGPPAAVDVCSGGE